MVQIFTGLSLTSSLLLFVALVLIAILFIAEQCENKKFNAVKNKIFKKESPEKKKIIKK